MKNCVKLRKPCKKSEFNSKINKSMISKLKISSMKVFYNHKKKEHLLEIRTDRILQTVGTISYQAIKKDKELTKTLSNKEKKNNKNQEKSSRIKKMMMKIVIVIFER